MKKITGSLLLFLIMFSVLHAEGGRFPSSVVGTDFDYITAADPSTFLCMEYQGFEKREIIDKRTNNVDHENAYIFNTHFTDGTTVDLYMDKDFGSKEAAERDAIRYTSRLGKLPTLYRENIKYLIVHTGGENVTAQSEDLGHFFMIYSDNATKRISTHDLEETFFHEGTHTALQEKYLHNMPGVWEAAAKKDGAYVTDYAMVNEKEDFAESALFAYTLMHHPERLPAEDRAAIEKIMPNRIAFFKDIFSTPTYSVREPYACDGSYSAQNKSVDTVSDQDVETQETNTYSRNIDEIIQDILVLELNETEDVVISFLEPWRGTADESSLLDATAAEFGHSRASLEKLLHNHSYTTSEESTSATSDTDQALLIKKIQQLLEQIKSLMLLLNKN